MGQKIGKISRSESAGVVSDSEFSDEECPKAKKALFNPYYRVLINECYSQATGDLPARILHRCGQQRSDFREFLEALGPEGKQALRDDLQTFLEAAIGLLDDEEGLKRLARSYGRAQVPLRVVGHKPDFFAAIADSIATECVFIGGQVTAASPTNTFKSWTILVGVMFSAVRDGYYGELRKTRRQSPGLDGVGQSSVDSASSSCNGEQASISSRGSPHVPRSSTEDSENRLSVDRALQPSSLPTSGVTARQTSISGSAARRAYKGSRSAAITTTTQDATPCTRSCDAICGEQGTTTPRHRDYRIRPEDRLRDDSPSISVPNSGRFTKNVSLDFDAKRQKRMEEIGRKHGSGYLTKHMSSSQTSVFDPNRIIDAFMNDQPF